MGVVDRKRQGRAVAFQKRRARISQQRRRVTDTSDFDKMAERSERDLLGRGGARQPSDRRLRMSLRQPLNRRAGKNRLANARRPRENCADLSAAVQRGFQ